MSKHVVYEKLLPFIMLYYNNTCVCYVFNRMRVMTKTKTKYKI